MILSEPSMGATVVDRLQRTAGHLLLRAPPGGLSAAGCGGCGDDSREDGLADAYTAARRILELGARGAAAQAEIYPRWESDTLCWYANGRLDGTKQYVVVDCASEPPCRRLASEQEIQTYAMCAPALDGGNGSESTNALPSLVPSVASPTGALVAYVQDHNLWLRDTSSGEAVALSTDGTLHYDYATELTATSEIPSSQPVLAEPALAWSPCGRYIATAILDCRNCPQLTMVHSSPPDQFRPKYYRYFYPLPGDQRVPTQTPVVFDVWRRSMVLIQTPPFPCLDIDPPWTGPTYSWCNGKVRYITVARGYERVAMEEACPATGDVRTLIEETADPLINWINGGREVLWLSERDGYAHLYLYSVGVESETGASTHRCRQLTSGEWVIRGVARVDETSRVLYFYGAGAEHGRYDDPYLRRLYSISLDEHDAKPVLLTPECADHSIVFSPAGDLIVDRYSRADLPTVAVLRQASTGSVLLQLEVADITPLLEVGWRMPVPCRSIAADGTTPLYSLLWPPHTSAAPTYSTSDEATNSFRESSGGNSVPSVPVLENVYPGPHSAHTPKRFSAVACSQCAAAAALGFAVVFIDGRGTGLRSREFREHSHKDLGGGVDDHPHVIRQMAAEHPNIGMDLERVGIWGHSAGGYASAHAILKFPEFYKVAVSSAGNHDHRMDKSFWNEQWMGWPIGPEYEDQSNCTIAHQLKGKLLIAHGDLDDNVPLPASIKLVNALIEADKDFDMLIMPGRNHGFGNEPYFTRRRWNYFVTHLMGKTPPPA